MAILMPTDSHVLAKAVADSLVVGVDDGARDAALFYWQESRACVQAVVAAVSQAGEEPVRSAAEALMKRPQDPCAYSSLVTLLVDRARRAPQSMAPIFAAAWQAETTSRLGYCVGEAYDPNGERLRLQDLVSWVRQHRRPARGSTTQRDRDPHTLVVIPFRDRSVDGFRARNLVASLLALRDQTAVEGTFAVTVVESDDAPRWADVVEPLCDHYIFARRGGDFNKSWTVNVGVVQTPFNPAVVCMLDADVLCDHAFITRNVDRFLRPGTGAHLTYGDMLCLDATASSHAIRERVFAGGGSVNRSGLRGFLVRRPPGACLWVRREVFSRVNGMDERYVGWGGEDNDFLGRVDLAAPVDRYTDELLHLYHPPSSRLDNGRSINAHVPPLSWLPEQSIGALPAHT
jgi:hypothetical protein